MKPGKRPGKFPQEKRPQTKGQEGVFWGGKGGRSQKPPNLRTAGGGCQRGKGAPKKKDTTDRNNVGGAQGLLIPYMWQLFKGGGCPGEKGTRKSRGGHPPAPPRARHGKGPPFVMNSRPISRGAPGVPPNFPRGGRTPPPNPGAGGFPGWAKKTVSIHAIGIGNFGFSINGLFKTQPLKQNKAEQFALIFPPGAK